jgi:hypothetical protein
MGELPGPLAFCPTEYDGPKTSFAIGPLQPHGHLFVSNRAATDPDMQATTANVFYIGTTIPFDEYNQKTGGSGAWCIQAWVNG